MIDIAAAQMQSIWIEPSFPDVVKRSRRCNDGGMHDAKGRQVESPAC